MINGPAWHTAGQQGASVKIGIIDGGFLGYPGLLGVDLPASVTVKNFVDGETDLQVDGTTKHGTACAEVIHDIAPAATLYLAKVSTNLDLQEAVTWLKNTNQVDIISTSMGWYNLTPGDGTGEFADLVQSARDAGILWATAASNDREAHWGGLYYDPNNTGYSLLQRYTERQLLRAGRRQRLQHPGRQQDQLSSCVGTTGAPSTRTTICICCAGAVLRGPLSRAARTTRTAGPARRLSSMSRPLTSGSATAYGFGITRYNSNRAVNFEVFAPGSGARLDEILHARSLANLADAPGALTVAALDVVAPYPQEFVQLARADQRAGRRRRRAASSSRIWPASPTSPPKATARRDSMALRRPHRMWPVQRRW